MFGLTIVELIPISYIVGIAIRAAINLAIIVLVK
jgi:hypothetical protein